MPTQVQILFPAFIVKMISKTRIDKKMKKKTDLYLVKTIVAAKKENKWVEIAHVISGPRRKQVEVDLGEIEKNTSEGDTVVVPGKVLGEGDITKKVRVAALGFSSSAVRKLKAKKGEVVSIAEEIKINPEAQGIKVMK